MWVYAAALLLCLLPLSANAQSDDRYPGWHNRMTGFQAVKEPRWGASKQRRKRVHYRTFTARTGLGGVVAPLAAKAREIEAACGSKVISSIRHTRIAGTGGRLSLHASGRAVDMQGNPSCIYSHLRNWPGGVSTDYGRVAHVHFSYAPGGPEWGIRFRHGGHRRHARRR